MSPAVDTRGAPHTPIPYSVRDDFPLLSHEIDGRPIVYLDSAATSQKPQEVIDSISSYYEQSNANIHRGVYALALEATDLFEGARERIAQFVNSTYEETIFTRNATEALNLVAGTWARENLKAGDVVLVTQLEHHSNVVPWQMICQETGARIDYAEIAPDGRLDLDDFDRRLNQGGVKLVSVCHVSNVLGTINPVKDLVARAHAIGAIAVVDGSQAVPQMPVDVRDIDADFYVWTGHKALGPTGIGVLHGRREILLSMRPWLGGGDMIKTVGPDSSTWNDLPFKFEAGTSAIAEGVGLGVAIDYLDRLGMENVRAHEQVLTQYALKTLARIKGITLLGPSAEQRGGVISFILEGIHPHDIAEICDRENVCIRTGHHCAQPLMRKLDLPATARASFHVYTRSSDIDALAAAVERSREVFRL